MAPGTDVVAVDWADVAHQLVSRGWARLTSAVEPSASAALENAGPGPWVSLPQTEGTAGVHQAGAACHSDVDGARQVVRNLADSIRRGIDRAAVQGVPPIPAFNHAQWCRAEGGQKFITPHRDPDTACGVIAIVTIRGQALFRAWDTDDGLVDAQRRPEPADQCETSDGDLVLLRGGGWPTPASRCPIHEHFRRQTANE
jgi:hypothetical protein